MHVSRPLRLSLLVAAFALLLGASPATDEPAAQLEVSARTYSMAQQVRWLDDSRFLVGRWDGSIGVFEAPANQDTATLVDALVLPSGQGVQMLVARGADTFVSSGDGASLLLWRTNKAGRFTPQPVPYPADAGVAVSGLFVAHDGVEYLVTGHEHGRLLVWTVGAELPSLERTVDLRMAEPIDYEHADEPLRHLRGLDLWKDDVVVVGAEDGGLHQVRLSDGAVLAQRLFNPDARLGINDLVVRDDRALVVNCASGSKDANVWLFALRAGGIDDRDAAKLLLDPAKERIFAFDVVTYERDGEAFAGITTKEGLLWRVRFAGDSIEAVEHVRLGRFLYGNAIDYDTTSRRIAAAGISVWVVSVGGGD